MTEEEIKMEQPFTKEEIKEIAKIYSDLIYKYMVSRGWIHTKPKDKIEIQTHK